MTIVYLGISIVYLGWELPMYLLLYGETGAYTISSRTV